VESRACTRINNLSLSLKVLQYSKSITFDALGDVTTVSKELLKTGDLLWTCRVREEQRSLSAELWRDGNNVKAQCNNQLFPKPIFIIIVQNNLQI
jgi:hypothetical protein